MATFKITSTLDDTLCREIEANEFAIDPQSGHIVFKSEPAIIRFGPARVALSPRPEILAVLVPSPGLLI